MAIKQIDVGGKVYSVTPTGIAYTGRTTEDFYNVNPNLRGQLPSYTTEQADKLWSGVLSSGNYDAYGNDITGQTIHQDALGSDFQSTKQDTIAGISGSINPNSISNPWYNPGVPSQASAPTSASQVKPVGGVNMPSLNYGTGNIANAVAGTSGVSSYIDTQQQMAAERQKQIEAQIKALNTSTQPLLDRLLGSKSPMEARLDAQQETGIDPEEYFADQKQKIAEIESLTQEYNNTKAMMEQQIAATGDKLASNNFINNQVAQIQRNAAPKLNMMSANINSKAATLEALQGNFNTAQDFVNQAVQDATAEFKYNMDVYTTFYEMNRSVIEALDEPYQQAYEAALGMAKSEYDRAVDEANAVGELMMDNPKAGITINDTFATAAQKVARAGGSLSYQQEQRLSSSGTGGGTTPTSTNTTVQDSIADATVRLNNTPKNQLETTKQNLINQVLDSDISSAEKQQIIDGIKSYGTTTEPTQQSLSKSPQSYVVQGGDTFYKLAQIYGTTVNEIQKANPNVNPNNLKIGQLIVLPAKTSIIDSIANFLRF